ncbi:MAG TPA: hypothetical protein VFQ65_12580 [Kofleriaceae bacterium]|nr:hypothetical protein [Kofleriaceae bacterium]
MHRAKPKAENAVVRKPVRDSPSQRITKPMSVADDGDDDWDNDNNDEVGLRDERDVEPMSAFEADASDRTDGENWTESAMENAIDTLPAERPIVIDDEPTVRHH